MAKSSTIFLPMMVVGRADLRSWGELDAPNASSNQDTVTSLIAELEASEGITQMMTTRSIHARTVRIKTKVKAGNDVLSGNHNQVRIKTKVKAGGGLNGSTNHNQVRIKTKVKAGALAPNHNQVRIRTKVKAGGEPGAFNHNQARIRTKV